VKTPIVSSNNLDLVVQNSERNEQRQYFGGHYFLKTAGEQGRHTGTTVFGCKESSIDEIRLSESETKHLYVTVLQSSQGHL